jgi:uncharacterized cupin superfamily protein
MPKIDLDTCPERSGTLYPEPYRATVRERRVRQISAAAGLSDFGVNVVTLGPGVWSSQRHWHDEDDEVVVMLDGELVLIEDDGRTLMRQGDIAAWPKGTTNGHHLVNESNADARFIVVGANKGGGGYSGIDMIFRAGESFYRHRDGKPYRQYTRQE